MKLQDFDFRVWDNVNKKFFKNPCVAKPFKKDEFIFGELIIVTSSKEFKQIKGDFEIEFYTGKKDCNGKKIYEGDIIKKKKMHRDGITHISEVFSEVKEVCFIDFRIHITRRGFSIYRSFRPEELEVIGNIHENPELLKE